MKYEHPSDLEVKGAIGRLVFDADCHSRTFGKNQAWQDAVTLKKALRCVVYQLRYLRDEIKDYHSKYMLSIDQEAIGILKAWDEADDVLKIYDLVKKESSTSPPTPSQQQ